MLGGSGYSKIVLYDSAGSSVIDSFTFTVREEEQLKVAFRRILDCPDKVMSDGSMKRYMRGFRVHIELNFLFDDYVSTTSDVKGSTCQEFLQDLFNHTGKIKIYPHFSDGSWISYWVLLSNNWDFEHAFGRWIGWAGTLIFDGTEILDISLGAPV